MPRKKTATKLAEDTRRTELPDAKGMEEMVTRSGTSKFGGYIDADFNPEFVGRRGVKLCDKMRKLDGTVAGALRALKYPLLASEWTVESYDRNDEKANEIAEFVRSQLFDKLEGGFSGFLREALGYLDFGFWYFEKVYARGKDGRIELSKLASCLPTAHEKWETADGQPGITQQLPSRDPNDPGPSNPSVPMSKLVLLTNEKEGDNWGGTPLLRGAYKHYFMKDQLYRIDGMKHERGAGIAVIRSPGDAASIKRAGELGENFNANEKMYVNLAGPAPSEGVAGWDFKLETAGIADQTSGLMASVQHHDRMITQSILAQFMDLGSGQGGSRALGDSQRGFFGFALKAVSDYLASTLNEQAVRELVELNYGKDAPMPKLRCVRPGDAEPLELARTLQILNEAGLLKNDAELKVWVSKAFGLPERTVDDFLDGVDDRPEDDTDDTDDTTEDGEFAAKETPQQRRARGHLTVPEKRMKLSEIERFIDAAEEKAKETIEAASVRERANLLEQAEKVIDSNDPSMAVNVELRVDPAFRADMTEQAQRSLERGKVLAAGEIGVKAVATPKAASKAVAARIHALLRRRADTISAAARERLLEIVATGGGKAAGLFEIERVIMNAAKRQDSVLTGGVTLTPLNEGRFLTFEDASEQIHSLVRTEILDRHTCPTCLSLDGREVSMTDPFAQLGQVHEHCRGEWTARLKTDDDLKPPAGIPKSIRDRFDTVGGVPVKDSYRPMPKPVVKKDSPAQVAIDDGKLPQVA